MSAAFSIAADLDPSAQPKPTNSTMRVLFLTDPLFTRHEREMVARLAIGLADEGTRIAWGVPASLAPRMSDSLLVPVVPYTEPRLGVTLRLRVRNLLDRVRELLDGDPDIVHIFGGGASRLGAEVARMTGAVPAFELWRPHLESAVRPLVNRAMGRRDNDSNASSGRVPLIIVPGDAIQRRANQQFPDSVVRKIPWGVHTARGERPQNRDSLCLLLMGPGRDAHAWQAAFHASLRIMRNEPRFHLFADAATLHRLHLWKPAREAGVLDRLSLIDDAESQRDLILGADILLYTDARGEARTILLDAMAARVTLIAAADPLTDSLIDGRTARLVADVNEAQWVEAIEQLVSNADTRSRLADSAVEYVQQNHRATRQIVSLTDAYEWVAGDSVRIGAES